MNLKTVAISKIVVEVAPSNKLQQTSLIETDGNIQPIRLGYNKENDTYWLIDGRRRLVDLIELGKTEVSAIVDENTSRDEGHLQALILNSGKPNQMDESDHIQHLLDAGLTVKQISSKANVQQQIVYSRIKLQNLLPEIKELLRSGKINYSAAKVISSMTLEKQIELLQKVEKLSYKNVSKFLSDTQSEFLELNGVNFGDDFDVPNINTTMEYEITLTDVETLKSTGVLTKNGITLRLK